MYDDHPLNVPDQSNKWFIFFVFTLFDFLKEIIFYDVSIVFQASTSGLESLPVAGTLMKSEPMRTVNKPKEKDSLYLFR